jgi:hypothetical protein
VVVVVVVILLPLLPPSLGIVMRVVRLIGGARSRTGVKVTME